jgi:hypothetical protein
MSSAAPYAKRLRCDTQDVVNCVAGGKRGGGVGCNPRVTFDGKVRNLGPRTFVCVLKFDSPLPEDHRVNILSTVAVDSLRHHCKLGGGYTRSPSPAPVSTEDRSGVGGSSDRQDEHSRIVLPAETVEQLSLS